MKIDIYSNNGPMYVINTFQPILCLNSFYFISLCQILTNLFPIFLIQPSYFLQFVVNFGVLSLESGQGLPANHPGSRVVIYTPVVGGTLSFLKQQLGGQSLFFRIFFEGTNTFLGVLFSENFRPLFLCRLRKIVEI